MNNNVFTSTGVFGNFFNFNTGVKNTVTKKNSDGKWETTSYYDGKVVPEAFRDSNRQDETVQWELVIRTARGRSGRWSVCASVNHRVVSDSPWVIRRFRVHGDYMEIFNLTDCDNKRSTAKTTEKIHGDFINLHLDTLISRAEKFYGLTGENA